MKILGIVSHKEKLHTIHQDRNGDHKIGLILPKLNYKITEFKYDENTKKVFFKGYFSNLTEVLSNMFDKPLFSRYKRYCNDSDIENNRTVLLNSLVNYIPEYEIITESFTMDRKRVSITMLKWHFCASSNVNIPDNYIELCRDYEIKIKSNNIVDRDTKKIFKEFFRTYKPIIKNRITPLIDRLVFNLKYDNTIHNNIDSFKPYNLYNYPLSKGLHDSENIKNTIQYFDSQYLGSNVNLINSARNTIVNLEICKRLSYEFNIDIKHLVKPNLKYSPDRFVKEFISSNELFFKGTSHWIRTSKYNKHRTKLLIKIIDSLKGTGFVSLQEIKKQISDYYCVTDIQLNPININFDWREGRVRVVVEDNLIKNIIVD